MSYTVRITETTQATVQFNSKEEALEWIKEPDYDLVRNWEITATESQLIDEVQV